MSAQGPAPEDRAVQIAAMREAEEAAKKIAITQPVEEVVPEQDDIELLAALAGSTAQTLRNSRFHDNVVAPMTSSVLDPRAVVGSLTKQKTGAGQPQRPSPSPVIRNNNQPVKVNPNDPQLELELFKKMDMTDVYNMLDSIREELKGIKDKQQAILKFIEDVKNA